MSHGLKRRLLVLGGVAGVLVLMALAVLLFVDINRYKPGLEAAASDLLGMRVAIDGRLRMGFLPGFHVTGDRARVLGEQGESIASARKFTLGIELLPLLHREVRLRSVDLVQPTLSIKRTPGGTFSTRRLNTAALLRLLDGTRMSLTDGALHYADTGSGERIEATDLDLVVRRMRFAGGGRPQGLKALALEADLACGEVRAKDLVLSALKVPIRGKDGVFVLDPITMQLFGGQMAASVQADLSGDVPACEVRGSLPHFRIEEFLRTLSPERAAEGTMDFTASLSMQGATMSRMVETMAGTVSLRGEDLVFQGIDLDRTLSRFDSSQNFNLVDVGAVFFAGPLGLAVTKGYGFASLFKGTGGTSRIAALVSVWKLEGGVAQAKDVAMATSENRIALQGGLDFVQGRFADVTVAAIDGKGCARVRQTLRGSFAKPVVEKPRVLSSLAGPVIKLYEHARGLFPAAPCEVFYSGSVAAPR